MELSAKEMVSQWQQDRLVSYFFDLIKGCNIKFWDTLNADSCSEDVNSMSLLVLSVQELLLKAKSIDTSCIKGCTDAYLYSDTAMKLVDLFPCTSGSSELSDSGIRKKCLIINKTKESVLELNTNLKVLMWLKENYPDCLGNCEWLDFDIERYVERNGLQGIVWMVLDDFGSLNSSDELEVSVFLRKFCCTFKGFLDNLCLEWIENVLFSKVLAKDTSFNSNASVGRLSTDFEDESSDTVTLPHLFSVAKLVSDDFIIAKCLFALLQVPFGKYQAVGDLINEAAQSVIAKLRGSSISESLEQAVKSHGRMRLAEKYGIKSINLRDKRQVRTAANIIACSTTHSETCLSDALMFIRSTSMSSYEVKSILARALVFRVDSLESKDDTVFSGKGKSDRRYANLSDQDPILESIVKKLPAEDLTGIIEMVVTTLFDLLEDITAGSLSGEDADMPDELRNSFLKYLHGSVVIIACYIDCVLSGVYSGKLMASSWVTSELLETVKNIRVMFLEFDEMISIRQFLDPRERQAILRDMGKAHARKLLADHGDVSGATASDLLNNSGIFEESVATILIDEIHSDLLSTTHRRACAVLDVSCVYFLNCMLSEFSSANHWKLVIQTAEAMDAEKVSTCSLNAAVQAASSLFRGGYAAALTDKEHQIADHFVKQTMVAREESLILLIAAATFCVKSSKLCLGCVNGNAYEQMEGFALFKAAQELLKQLTLTCQAKFLGYALDYLCVADIVLSVYERFDFHASGNSSYRKMKSNEFSALLGEGVLSRDGVLLSPSTVLIPLLKFCTKEVIRRADANEAVTKGDVSGESDLSAFVIQLQKSENNMLAVRILLSSWLLDASKYKLFYATVQAVCRKVLTYREIDVELSISLLASLPEKVMVKELQSVIPSIQSDFNRLKITAFIGEQLALLWDKESLLRVFQSFQNNAKWWSLLAGHGINVDTKTFQHSVAEIRTDYIKSLVPELMDRSSMNLELVQDYCRQFDLTTEFANLCYIKRHLLLEGLSLDVMNKVSDWEKKVTAAAAGVRQEELAALYKDILVRIPSMDYERIYYLCRWLVNYLTDEFESTYESTKVMQGKSKLGVRNKVPFGITQDSINEIPEDSAKIVTSLPREAADMKADIDRYNRYAVVIEHLQSIRLPAAAQSLFQSQIMGSKSVRADRIPFWSLVNNSWETIEKVIGSTMVASEKDVPTINSGEQMFRVDDALSLTISSMCPYLLISKDEFHARRVKMVYQRFKQTVNSKQKSSELTKEFVKFTNETVGLMSSEYVSAELWKWIYLQESSCSNETFSELSKLVLQNAVKIIAKFDMSYSSAVSNKEITLLYNEITRLSIQSKCAVIVHEFCESLTKSIENLESPLGIAYGRVFTLTAAELLCGIRTQYLSEFERLSLSPQAVLSGDGHACHTLPKTLLNYLFHNCAVELSWAFQLFFMNKFGTSLTYIDIVSCTMAPFVVNFLNLCSVTSLALQNIIKEYDLERTWDDNSGNTGKSISGVQRHEITVCDELRHTFITKCLSELHSNASTGGKSNENPKSSTNLAGFGAFGNVGFVDLIRRTSAETRRAEDVYAGFAIACLVGSCAESSTRDGFVRELESTTQSKGKGDNVQGKTAKRITARTRHRSALALLFLGMEDCETLLNSMRGVDETFSSDTLKDDMQLRRWYLYCMSEMQETRLGTPAEALSNALINNKLDEQGDNKISVSSLVTTWLYDEGDSEDVLELCRDLFVASNCLEPEPWAQLLSRMHENNNKRSLMCTLSVIGKMKDDTGTSLLFTILSGKWLVNVTAQCSSDFSRLYINIVEVCCNYLTELLRAIHQSIELFDYQRGSSTLKEDTSTAVKYVCLLRAQQPLVSDISFESFILTANQVTFVLPTVCSVLREASSIESLEYEAKKYVKELFEINKQWSKLFLSDNGWKYLCASKGLDGSHSLLLATGRQVYHLFNKATSQFIQSEAYVQTLFCGNMKTLAENTVELHEKAKWVWLQFLVCSSTVLDTGFGTVLTAVIEQSPETMKCLLLGAFMLPCTDEHRNAVHVLFRWCIKQLENTGVVTVVRGALLQVLSVSFDDLAVNVRRRLRLLISDLNAEEQTTLRSLTFDEIAKFQRHISGNHSIDHATFSKSTIYPSINTFSTKARKEKINSSQMVNISAGYVKRMKAKEYLLGEVKAIFGEKESSRNEYNSLKNYHPVDHAEIINKGILNESEKDDETSEDDTSFDDSELELIAKEGGDSIVLSSENSISHVVVDKLKYLGKQKYEESAQRSVSSERKKRPTWRPSGRLTSVKRNLSTDARNSINNIHINSRISSAAVPVANTDILGKSYRDRQRSLLSKDSGADTLMTSILGKIPDVSTSTTVKILETPMCIRSPMVFGRGFAASLETPLDKLENSQEGLLMYLFVKYKALWNVKKEIKKTLREFESNFYFKHGRYPHNTDKQAVLSVYLMYRDVKKDIGHLRSSLKGSNFRLRDMEKDEGEDEFEDEGDLEI